jgi:polysaccharide export outer membrane protein
MWVKITSFHEKTAMLFNSSNSKYSQNLNDIGVYLNSYTVADDGNIDFPLTGKIQIQNLTIEKVKEKINKILDEYLKETMIIVKLINFNITMLGEIKKPGQYKIYQDKINLFEAIAMAGDLSDFANRNKIKLIRQSKQGAVIHKLDITDQNIMESDFFYLMPNDVIYIEPLKGKQFAFANFPYSIMFSAITTLILMLNYIK